MKRQLIAYSRKTGRIKGTGHTNDPKYQAVPGILILRKKQKINIDTIIDTHHVDIKTHELVEGVL